MKPFYLSLLASCGIFAGLSSAATTVKGTIRPGPFPEELNGSNFTYPWPVKLFRFTSQLQSLDMAFMDVKPAKCNGKTAILLHGKNFCGATWEETIQTLVDSGYRVIAPDQIGFCKSSKPLAYQFSLNQLAYNTRSLLDTLEIGNVTVIGHSLGGMLGTRFGLQYPETVDKLVLVDAVGLEDYVGKGVPYISVDDNYRQEASSTYASIKAYEQQFYYVGQWKNSYDTWVNMLVNIYNGSEREGFIRSQARIVDMVLTSPVAQYFKDLKPLTLVIVGDKDKTAIGAQWAPADVSATLGHFDELGPAVAAEIPNSSFYHFTDLGHAPQISDPKSFHKVLLSWLV